METLRKMKRPSKEEQRVAITSYGALATVIEQLKSDNPEIEIEETAERIKIPSSALKFLAEILKAMSQGKPISIVPIAAEVTTQKAAEILGCSRPHVVKLLNDGEIEYTMVGNHRRVKYEELLVYKKAMKKNQKQHIVDIMKSDEEIGLYDS